VFDGVECAGMEGLVQAFKFDKEHIQVEVCKLSGFAAKKRGRPRNSNWQRVQKLWWKGVAYDRDSKEYQQLLDRAYDALFENDSFKRALKASGRSTLTHSMGRNNIRETVLTEREFCSRLTKLRDRLDDLVSWEE
jgi:hypothetical protein